MNDFSCLDCKFYLPVDVFRGICKLTKEKTGPDDQACEQAEQIAKCKFCSNYSSEKDYLGKCMDTVLAYPDMIASKCADFQWCKQD